MARDLFCWPCACFCFVWALLSCFHVLSYLLSWPPPILLPHYWFSWPFVVPHYSPHLIPIYSPCVCSITQPLEQVKVYKYLGMWLEGRYTWKKTCWGNRYKCRRIFKCDEGNSWERMGCRTRLTEKNISSLDKFYHWLWVHNVWFSNRNIILEFR